MKKNTTRFWAALLALSMLLSMAACGGSDTTAASMHLRRSQGTVSVSDSNGKDVPILDNLGLYSGYEVGTRSASYAWIDLDDVKLAKLDQNSEIAIQKEGKALDIEVKSGSLFFNVTEPLADDETMNIRTSTILVGIRGTCGWVEERDGLSRVYILEGKVECTAGERTVPVNAGEFAELTADGELVVKPFTQQDIPAFVRDETDAELPGGADETPGPEPSETPEDIAGPAEGVTWTLENGVLTISGTGPMEDYDNSGTYSPWYEDRDSITKVTITDGVTSIGGFAFYDCKNLSNVTIGNSVTSLGYRSFTGCISLTSVTIPNSVTRINRSVFTECSSLTSVTISDSVTSIGSDAFYSCLSLTDVYYGGSEAQWDQIVIDNTSFGNLPLLHATIHYNS